MISIRDGSEIGDLVRQRRRSWDWTQDRLAREAQTGRPWIVQLEKGKTSVPLDKLLRVLACLELAIAVHDLGPAHLRSGFNRRDKPRQTHGDGRPPRIDRADARNSPARHGADQSVADALRAEAGKQYRSTDLSAFSPNQTKFYDPEYLDSLRKMVEAVIEAEGPIYEQVLARRLAQAHGFKHTGPAIQLIVKAATDPTLARSAEDESIIIWPKQADPQAPVEFRRAPPGMRHHSDVPMPELTGLAHAFLSQGASPEEAVQHMRQELCLARTTKSLRERLEKAVEIARDRTA